MADAAHSLATRVRAINRRIFADALTVGVFSSLAKIAGGVKVIVQARFFGTSDAMDAFLIAFAVPSFVADVAAGALSPSLIPTLLEVREKRGREAADRLYSSVLLGSLGMLTLLAAVLAAVSRFVLPLLGSGFDPPKMQLTTALFFGLLVWLPVSGLIATWRALLNADEEFALAAGAPVLTPILSIALLFAASESWGIATLEVGTLLGILAEAAVLAAAIRRKGYPVIPRWHGWSPELRLVFEQYAPMVAGTLMAGGTVLIDQAVAARLGPGSVAVLTYGAKFVSVLLGVGAMALSTAALPHLSRMAARQDWTGLRHTARAWFGWILATTVPLTLLLMYFSEPIVRLVLQRGAFTGAATHAVAVVQSYSLVKLPLAVLLAVELKLVSSLRRNELLLIVAGATLIVNVVLDFVLMHWLGVPGIALAGAGVNLVSLVLIWLLLRRVTGRAAL